MAPITFGRALYQFFTKHVPDINYTLSEKQVLLQIY